MIFLISSDRLSHRLVVSRGMVSPAVVLISRVGRNVVLRVHIPALKFGLFLFHSPTSVLSSCTNFLPIVVNLYFLSSAALRCNACSFPEYFTPKSSTTKVNFIGPLFFFP